MIEVPATYFIYLKSKYFNPKFGLVAMFGYINRNEKYIYFFAIAILIISSLLIKAIYLQTAESTYNTEELPLAPMGLVGGSDATTNVSVTRLYGTTHITSALSLSVFGFTVFGLKAPNILFFFFSLIFLYFFSKRFLKGASKWYALLTVSLLCFGPPVIQIWSMKNRGGFIENIFALVFCLWVLISVEKGRLGSSRELLLGVIVGLAIWSQPLGLIWGGVLLSYVVYERLYFGALKAAQSALTLLYGLVLGLLPLISLNFLFHFNTVNVIAAGEIPGGVDLGYLGRLQEILIEGVPRLLGLKEQWSRSWIVSPPLASLLYLVFVLPSFIAIYRLLAEFFNNKKLSIGLLLALVAFCILAANVISSWGNFQGEPRRLLLLYVPFVALTAYGLIRTPRLALTYFVIWFSFNIWSNYTYISKNIDGFSHPVYRPLVGIAKYLKEEKINAIYSDVWVGSRITFASNGTIPWYRSSYTPSSYGFSGDDKFESDEAMIFDMGEARGISAYFKFIGDIQAVGVSCQDIVVDNFRIVHGCDSHFYLSDVASYELNNFSNAASGDVLISNSITSDKVKVIAGSKIGAFVVANGEPGYLIYGPYTSLPQGNYSLTIKGKSSSPFVVDICASEGREIFARSEFNASSDPDSNILAKVDFTVGRMVSDLEVRVHVSEGSDAQISDYEVVVR